LTDIKTDIADTGEMTLMTDITDIDIKNLTDIEILNHDFNFQQICSFSFKISFNKCLNK